MGVTAVLMMLAAGCQSSTTVTVTDAGVAEATATARTEASTTEPDRSLDDAAEEDEEDSDDGKAVDDDASGDTAAAPAATAAPTPVPTATSPDRSGVGALAPGENCRFTEVDSFGDVQIEIDYVADSITEQQDTILEYVVFDGNGQLLTESSRFVEDLKPGERLRLAIDTVEDAPTDPAALEGITCEVVGLDSFGFGPSPARAMAGDSCRFIELDSVGDIQVEIDVANPLATRAELAIDYALRDANGTRFGDGIEFTDAVDPGARYVGPSDSLTDLPSWLDESDVACEILAIQEF